MITSKLTTAAACRVAGLDRNRFNEHVAAGRFTCAPATVAGRARFFGPDDMIALRLFRELMEDGFNADRAGVIACAVSEAARSNPNAATISYVETFVGSNIALPTKLIPDPSKWDQFLVSGSDVRKVTTFNIAKMRRLIAHYTEEERAIIGERDE